MFNIAVKVLCFEAPRYQTGQALIHSDTRRFFFLGGGGGLVFWLQCLNTV